MKKLGMIAVALAFIIGICRLPKVFASSTPYVQSDTTISFPLPRGNTYQVKFTVHGTHADPHIAAGNGSVLQIINTKKSRDSNGNDVYYLKVKAIGAPETTSAIYTTLPGQKPVRHFTIKVVQTYPPKMYKVGSEIPAGEYVLISTSPFGSYFEITKDSSGALDSLLANDIFCGRSIVTVESGQYFNVSDATIYKIDGAPVINRSSKELSDGMYRVGMDIPAGEFTLHPTNPIGGYYELDKDSKHVSDSIIGNGEVKNQQYLTLKEGQYLTLKGAKIELK